MKSIIKHTIFLLGAILFVMDSFAADYRPLEYKNLYELSNIQVLDIDNENLTVKPDATKYNDFAPYFANSLMYETDRLLRIIPKTSKSESRVDYIDIKNDGTGFGTNSQFSIAGPHVYLNKVRLFRDAKNPKASFKIELDVEKNYPLKSRDHNLKAHIVMTATPRTTGSLAIKKGETK